MMEIIEQASCGIAILLVCVATGYWIRRRIHPWQRMDFIRDQNKLADILAGIVIGGGLVSLISLIDNIFK